MKIGIIQASSQKEKNSLLYNCTIEAAKKYGHEVINFGCFENEAENYCIRKPRVRRGVQ